MIVEFAGGITSASGTLFKNRNGSRVIFTTRRAPSSNKNKVRMYLRSADSYKRKKPLSDAEIAAHDLFTRRAKYVPVKGGGGDEGSPGLYGCIGVCHRIAVTGSQEHGNIVLAVTGAVGVFDRNSKMPCHMAQGISFISTL